MTNKSKQFIADIAEVCRKHGVKVGEGETYDNEENYVSTDYYFFGPDIQRVEMSDIQSAIGDE